MKIAVIGAGGVGGYFGGLLANAGEDVTFVARGDHGRALKERGLMVRSVAGDFKVNPVKVIETIADLDSPDLVLFTVKTYDTQVAAAALAKVVGNNTLIITFQNGVDNDLAIKQIIPHALVFPGVCYVISARAEPGVIEQIGGARKLIFGARNPNDNHSLEPIEKLMRQAGIDAALSPHILTDQWKKYIFITAFAGMTAMTRKPIGEILVNPETRAQYESVVKESITVAERLGIDLPEDIFNITMETTTKTAPASKSSLLIDIENGRRNEIETLNDYIVKLASQFADLSVPMNERIYKEIKGI